MSVSQNQNAQHQNLATEAGRADETNKFIQDMQDGNVNNSLPNVKGTNDKHTSKTTQEKNEVQGGGNATQAPTQAASQTPQAEAARVQNQSTENEQESYYDYMQRVLEEDEGNRLTLGQRLARRFADSEDVDEPVANATASSTEENVTPETQALQPSAPSAPAISVEEEENFDDYPNESVTYYNAETGEIISAEEAEELKKEEVKRPSFKEEKRKKKKGSEKPSNATSSNNEQQQAPRITERPYNHTRHSAYLSAYPIQEGIGPDQNAAIDKAKRIAYYQDEKAPKRTVSLEQLVGDLGMFDLIRERDAHPSAPLNISRQQERNLQRFDSQRSCIERNMAFYGNGHINIEGQQVIQDGPFQYIQLPPRVEEVVNDFAAWLSIDNPLLQRDEIIMFALIQNGFGIDTDNKVFGQTVQQLVSDGVFENYIIEGLRGVRASIEQFGVPFANTKYSREHNQTTSAPRSPLGFIPSDLLAILVNSPNFAENFARFSGAELTASSLQEAQRRVWLTRTLPRLEAETAARGTAGAKQLRAIEDAMMALLFMNETEINIEDYGLSRFSPNENYSDFMDANRIAADIMVEGYMTDSDQLWIENEFIDSRREAFQRDVEQRLMNKRTLTPFHTVAETSRVSEENEYGEMVTRDDVRYHKGFDWIERTRTIKRPLRDRNGNVLVDHNGEEICQNVVTYDKGEEKVLLGMALVKGLRILGNIPLTVAAMFEGAINYVEIRAMNEVLTAADYKPTSDSINILATRENNAKVAICIELYRSGGKELLTTYVNWVIENGREINQSTVGQFLSANTVQFSNEKASALVNKINKAVEFTMGGAGLFKGIEAAQFLRSYMQLQSSKAELNSNGENKTDRAMLPVTAEELDRLLKTNATDTIATMFASPEGINAIGQMEARSVNKTSARLEQMKKWMRSNGTNEAALAMMFQSLYVRFNMVALDRLMPFSNTLALIAASRRAQQEGNETILEDQLGGIELSTDGKLLGSNGLKKALFLDCLSFGQNALIIGIVQIIAAFGVEPPDDDDDDEINGGNKFLNPFEWKFNLPGHDEPVPFRQVWAEEDILQAAIPVGIALTYIWSDPKNEPLSVRCWNAGRMVTNGVADLYGNNALIRTAQFVPSMMDFMENGLTNPPAWFLDNFLNLAEKAQPLAISQFTDINTAHAGEEMRAFWKEIDPETGEEIGRSALGAILNKHAFRSPAGWLLAQGIGFFSGHKYGWENSGYVSHHDEDIAQTVNQRSFDSFIAALKEQGIDTEAEFDNALEAWCVGFIEELATYDSIDDAVNDGYMLSTKDAWILRNWLKDNRISNFKYAISQLEEQNRAGTISRTDYFASLKYLTELKQTGYDILNALAYEGLIYNPDQYHEIVQTTQYNYAADSLADVILGIKDSDHYYGYGDSSTSWSPIITPDTGTIRNREIFADDTDYEGNYGDFRTSKYNDENATSDGRHWVPNYDNPAIKAFRDSIERMDDEIAAEIEGGSGDSDNLGATNLGEIPNTTNVTLGYMSEGARNLIEQATPTPNGHDGDKVKPSDNPWLQDYGNGTINVQDGNTTNIENIINEYQNRYPTYNYYGGGYGGGSYGGSSRVYSNKPGSINPNNPATIRTHTPYATTRDYLAPGFTTKGSREAYARGDI